MNPFKNIINNLLFLFVILFLSPILISKFHIYKEISFVFLLWLFSFVFLVLKENILYAINKKYFHLAITLIAIPFLFLNFLNFSDYGFEGGHDPGVYTESAINISKNHTFEITKEASFQSTYPGLVYSNKHFITQFPPVYPVYLSYYYNFFGINGLAIGVIILELIAIILIIKIFEKFKISDKYLLLPIILFLINYYTIIFYRSTYVENFSLVINLLIVLFVISKEKYFYHGLFILGVLATTRSEGIINLILYSLLCIPLKKNILKTLLLSLLFSIPFFYYNLVECNYFINNVLLFINGILNKSDVINETLRETTNYNRYIFNVFYTISSFEPLGIGIILIVSIFGFFKLDYKKIQSKLLPIFFIFIPQLSYLFNSQIAFYLPWFMRRMFPNILIFSLIIFSIVIIKNIFGKSISIIMVTFILLLNLITSSKILLVKETGTINFVDSIKKLAINQESLFIFTDRFGIENLAPSTYFIGGIKTYYDRIPIDNPEIFSCINKSEEKNIYLITSAFSPLDGAEYNGNQLNESNLVSNFFYKEKHILNSCDVRNYVMNSQLFNSYKEILDICRENNPPTNIIENSKEVYIYKIDTSEFKKTKNCSDENTMKMLDSETHAEYKSYLK